MNLLLAISKTLTGSFNDELIQKDKYGMNALHIAVENGSTDVVKGLSKRLRVMYNLRVQSYFKSTIMASFLGLARDLLVIQLCRWPF